VRFHFAGDPYDPFVVRGGQLLTRPLETSLVAVNQWLPVGSSLRTVNGVRELLATAIGQPGGGITLILDNERALARPVVLHSTRSLHLAVLSPARAGLQTKTLSPTRGRIRVSVAPNSLLAVSTSP
jgi:hypothetical protein